MPDKDETQRLVEETRERRKQAAQAGHAKSRGETITDSEPSDGEKSEQPEQQQTSES